MEYFTSSLRTAIIHDFSDPSILLRLRALGLLGKLLTGPWMTVSYGNKEGKSNLEVVTEIKMAVANLRHLAHLIIETGVVNIKRTCRTTEKVCFGHGQFPPCILFKLGYKMRLR